MKEIWKDIDGYLISNLGNVKSFKQGYEHSLKQTKSNRGYLTVCFTTKGKCKNHYIHRLVAQAFIPNPENKPQVNHKDGNKLNNCVDNLEWVSACENMRHAYKNNLIKHCFGSDNHNHKNIYQISTDGKTIKEWGSITEASRELNLKQSSISRVCLGKRKTTGGYIWKYKDAN